MGVGEHEVHELAGEEATGAAVARVMEAGDFAMMGDGGCAFTIVYGVVGVEFLEEVGDGP